MNDVDIVLSHLKDFGPQGSWHWDADARFARAIGDHGAAGVIEDAYSHAYLLTYQLAAMYSVRHIKRRRLRALRKLVKQGLVKAHWRGTGPGGATEFGTNRVRQYGLVTEGAKEKR